MKYYIKTIITLVQYEATKKWDGKLPTYTGSGGVPLINIK